MADKQNVVELTPAQAEQHYEQAVASDSNDAESFMELGAAHYIAHHWDAAITAFEKAVALRRDLAHAHYYLGVLYAARGDKLRAEKELNDVLSMTKNPMLIAQAKARIPAVTGPENLGND